MTTTPVIPGFHPDPSICRAGETYYVANSSFEYMPGVPIWRSTDLVRWTQVGNALTRANQIRPHSGAAGSGVYAPTLRHHDGRFWLVTTDIGTIQDGHLIVSATDPDGPWTDAVHTRGTLGIDPDLSWDEEGVCHLTWASFHPNLRGIASCPVDPATGELLDEPRLLWPGSGLAHPEGPHLYRIDGWWYLLLAEGGTERGHSVTIARARTLDGPFEPAPHNPILSHRSSDHPVQNTGHADLVECVDGTWAMVYLGVRPRGTTPAFHTNGRETFVAGVDWVDGWPVVEEDRFTPDVPDTSFVDTFASAQLHPRWVSPGSGPDTFSVRGEDGLTISALPEGLSRSLLCARVQDLEWTARVRMDVAGGTGRFVLRIDDAHWYGLTVEADTVQASIAVGPAVSTIGRATHSGGVVDLRISARAAPGVGGRPGSAPDLITLSVADADGSEEVFGEFDGRYLSTEVAGGFTGRMLGIEAVAGAIEVLEVSYSAAAPSSA